MDIIVARKEKEIEDAHKVRTQVFVKEQGVPIEREKDAYEDVATHFVGYENGTAICAGRFRPVDTKVKVERVCVVVSARHQGIGFKLMNKIEETARSKGYTSLKLHSQVHAKAFYERIGYQVVSEEFIDAGIPHVAMEKQLIPTNIV